MTYVIGQPCVDVKDRACVEECPVDCIYEGKRSLYIHPDECVDCGACEPVCPVEAIFYEEDLPLASAAYLADNERFFTETLPGQAGPLDSPRWRRTRRPAGRGHDHGDGPAAGGHVSSASEPATASRRRRLIVALRESSTPLGVVQLSERLDIHPNTVRFHLDTLVRAGQVERVHGTPAGPGRPPLAFRMSPGMDPMGPRNYRLLAGMLVDQLATEPDAAGRGLAAGRAWGRQLRTPAPARRGRRRPDAVEQLAELRADLGFEPERRTSDDGEAQIVLRNCPFLDLVESRTHVVCPIHLGLMQGAMAAAQSPVTVERLEPFVEPGLCLAHLGPAPDRS